MKFYSQKIGEDNFEIVRSSTQKQGFHPLPEQYTSEDVPFINVTEVLQEDETGETRLVRQYNVDTAAKSAAEGERTKTKAVEDAYKAMDTEVFSKMYEVFRTNRADSATAYFETWKDMKANAASYASLGIKVDHQVNNADDTELFDPGSALDTEQKVLDYATRKIEQALEYGVWRMQRIQQFKNERETILNS